MYKLGRADTMAQVAVAGTLVAAVQTVAEPSGLHATSVLVLVAPHAAVANANVAGCAANGDAAAGTSRGAHLLFF